MLNAPSSKSVYYQSTCCRNLPRLLNSFTQADIHHTVLSCVDHHPTQAGEPTETVELLLDPASYAKFQQVFLGQRCVRLMEYGEHTFWDSRTGLTIHIIIQAETLNRSDDRRSPQSALPARSRHHHTYQLD